MRPSDNMNRFCAFVGKATYSVKVKGSTSGFPVLPALVK